MGSSWKLALGVKVNCWEHREQDGGKWVEMKARLEGQGLLADLQGIWFHQLTVTETKYLTKTTLDRDLFWLHTLKSLSLRSSCFITWYLRQSRASWPWERSAPRRQEAETEEWPSKHPVCILLPTTEPQFTPFSGPPQIDQQFQQYWKYEPMGDRSYSNHIWCWGVHLTQWVHGDAQLSLLAFCHGGWTPTKTT